jgi:hypothetical protein
MDPSPALAVDFVTDIESGDSSTDSGDDTGQVQAKDHRRDDPHVPGGTRHDLDVEGVHAAGFHPHQNLAVSGGRALDGAQRRLGPELVKHDRLHHEADPKPGSGAPHQSPD